MACVTTGVDWASLLSLLHGGHGADQADGATRPAGGEHPGEKLAHDGVISQLRRDRETVAVLTQTEHDESAPGTLEPPPRRGEAIRTDPDRTDPSQVEILITAPIQPLEPERVVGGDDGGRACVHECSHETVGPDRPHEHGKEIERNEAHPRLVLDDRRQGTDGRGRHGGPDETEPGPLPLRRSGA